MNRALTVVMFSLLCAMMGFSVAAGQEKKLERYPYRRRFGGSAAVDDVVCQGGRLRETRPCRRSNLNSGYSMALQAMLSGEVPIIQLGGTASMQANLAGADTVMSRPFSKNFCSHL